ncbi:MAG: hypothetical protein K5654_09130 [Lachnospiraceae bacterium]|nr:hypothetical protein [Lachnospiraceae bacterium]
MKIDILIIFEYASRELESALLLEYYLKKEGYSVKVVQASWSENISHLIYQPKIIVIPWCYDDEEYNLFCRYKGSLKKHKFKMLNLHCEQITNKNAVELVLPKGNAKNMYHIAWGKYFEELLVSVGISRKQIEVAGSSRLDFFKEPYRKISKSKEELANQYSLDNNKKWVLLIGNFSQASFSHNDLNVVKEKGYKDIDAMSQLAEKTYYELIKWFERASYKDNISSELEFIYRPHPSELITEQMKNLEKNGNFHVIRNYAIRDWIVNSDIAFSWCSTSTVEVASAGIPIYNLRPYKIPEMLNLDALEKVKQIETYDEFEKVLEDFCKNTLMESNQDFLEHISYYYNVSSESTVNCTVKYIKEIMNDDSNFCERKEWFFFGLKKTINYFIKKILHKLNVLKKIKKYQQVDNAYIEKKEIHRIRTHMEEVLFTK